jgi:hypothetical protein
LITDAEIVATVESELNAAGANVRVPADRSHLAHFIALPASAEWNPPVRGI